MGGHSSVMLSRLTDCHVFYRSIPPGYAYCTFFIHLFSNKCWENKCATEITILISWNNHGVFAVYFCLWSWWNKVVCEKGIAMTLWSEKSCALSLWAGVCVISVRDMGCICMCNILLDMVSWRVLSGEELHEKHTYLLIRRFHTKCTWRTWFSSCAWDPWCSLKNGTTTLSY